MKQILLILWQLPQCLLGWILLLIYKGETFTIHDNITIRFSNLMKGGISLGHIIIIRPTAQIPDIEHEYGHCLQSKYLGWLYLLIIGIPSLLWASNYKGATNEYYKFYTESWADKLGKVTRNN